MPPFGKLIRAHRSHRGLFLADQAEALKVGLAVVSAYETGTKRPTTDYVEKVADFLGLTYRERQELRDSLANSSNFVILHPKNQVVVTSAYRLSKRLNELSPQEIVSLSKVFNIDGVSDV